MHETSFAAMLLSAGYVLVLRHMSDLALREAYGSPLPKTNQVARGREPVQE